MAGRARRRAFDDINLGEMVDAEEAGAFAGPESLATFLNFSQADAGKLITLRDSMGDLNDRILRPFKTVSQRMRAILSVAFIPTAVLPPTAAGTPYSWPKAPTACRAFPLATPADVARGDRRTELGVTLRGVNVTVTMPAGTSLPPEINELLARALEGPGDRRPDTVANVNEAVRTRTRNSKDTAIKKAVFAELDKSGDPKGAWGRIEPLRRRAEASLEGIAISKRSFKRYLANWRLQKARSGT